MPDPENKTREDLCFVNGAIYTCNPHQPWAEAMAVKGGRIVAVGARAEVEIAAGPGCRRIDLAGRMAMPGIIDGHNHVLEGARGQLFELQLGAHMTFNDILAAIEGYASRPGRNEWVVGAPFLLANCPEMETEAGRQALDAVSHGRPVMLRDLAFHSRFTNSLALERAGVSRDTLDTANGVIVRDAAGEPTGLFHESAGDLIENAVPPLSRVEWLACSRHSMKLLNGVGVTGFGLAAASVATLGALRQFDEAGELTAWAAGFMLMEPLLLALERDGVGEELVARRAELQSTHLRVDFAKFFMDGVPLMRTAAFIEPYLPDPRFPPGFSGHTSHGVKDLAARIARLDREGISVKVHTIGDRAIRDVLDAIEVVRATNPVRGPRHSIAHLVYIQEADIQRLRRLDVIADLNPPMWFPGSEHDRLARRRGRCARRSFLADPRYRRIRCARRDWHRLARAGADAQPVARPVGHRHAQESDRAAVGRASAGPGARSGHRVDPLHHQRGREPGVT